MDWAFWFFVVYGLLFFAACLGLGFWHIRKRRERPPVEFKLLRGPGETLRRRLAKFDENLIFHIGGWGVVPLVVFSLALHFGFSAFKFHTWMQLWCATGVVVFLFAIALLYSIRRVMRGLFRYRADWLGYMGERFVAEKIAPLEREGFRIFHDVPAEAGNRKFNLDHVIVGPNGLWLVETKTRRKGRARPGYKENEVTFDGERLIWPWGEDRNGLEQAEAEARWLSEWVQRLTGVEIATRPILALPGWWVNERKLAHVRVLNPINIPAAVRSRRERTLSDEKIDLIARQLEELCRDVEE